LGGFISNKVQEQVPLLEAQANRFPILRELFKMPAQHSKREAAMVMRKRVVRMCGDYLTVQSYGIGIVLGPQKVVSARVADIAFAWSATDSARGMREKTRQNENRCDHYTPMHDGQVKQEWCLLRRT
jgi:hypothetical protein